MYFHYMDLLSRQSPRAAGDTSSYRNLTILFDGKPRKQTAELLHTHTHTVLYSVLYFAAEAASRFQPKMHSDI